MNDIFRPSPVKRAGLLEGAVQKLFTRSATVADTIDIGTAFRIITLQGDALRGATWTPGAKIQIQLGGWVQRTYTPLDWDAVTGRTRILAYRHGDGPGAQWARTVRRGDACVVFGPRRSIQLASIQAPVIVFGDETSIGLAAALSRHGGAPAVHALLEVSSLARTQPVLTQLQLEDAYLCQRLGDGAHFHELEAQLSALLMQDATAEIILTGRASSIQHMARFLKQTGVGAGRRQSKAYWADGKKGLD